MGGGGNTWVCPRSIFSTLLARATTMRPLVTGTVAICFNIFVRKEKDHMIGTLTHWGGNYHAWLALAAINLRIDERQASQRSLLTVTQRLPGCVRTTTNEEREDMSSTVYWSESSEKHFQLLRPSVTGMDTSISCRRWTCCPTCIVLYTQR